jgi:hypothetical protein
MSSRAINSMLSVIVILFSTFFIPITSASAQDTSICGWIENNSFTGALAPTFTVWGTNEVIDLDGLESQPFHQLMNLGIPGYFRVYDPVFQYPGNMTNFSRIEKVSSCEPPPATCQDPAATNFGQVGDCTYPPPATCQDPTATNFGQVGDCTYPPPATCQDPTATNFGQVGDCTYPPPATCQDPAATNFGQVGDCTYQPTTQNGILELSVTPITQRVNDAPITLSNGTTDNGEHDCFVAAISMALEYFKTKNILNSDDTTNYRSIVPIVRGTTPWYRDLTMDPAFVARVTNNKLSARPWYTPPDNLSVAIETELKAGRPVVAAVPNGYLLAKHWTGMAGHSILVYGLHDGRVYYVDPWDGNRYDMSTQDFVIADTFKDGSFLITFERPQ